MQDARDGAFAGSDIPHDLQRQWIQGTGPGAKPDVPIEKSIRNVAYALLSGADGWMFDGEDALGQLSTMALDNQRNLKLAIHRDPRVHDRGRSRWPREMNAWAQGFFGRPIVADWRAQLDFTTKIFRARGLHLDDRHVRRADGAGFSASIVDATLYVVNNQRALRESGSSLVLYLPKIQTAEEAALWHDILSALENHLALRVGTIKTYVLVEQLEAVFQLMEIRAALGPRFVGFNTGRWDYINSVSDALAWDPAFINPNIDAMTMTYGYMRNYEDRVRRAVNTPDQNGNFALWQGGMEPNIPVGSAEGVTRAMERAVAAASASSAKGASGKWVAHWKMVHIVRPVWEKVGEANQLGRAVPASHLHARGRRGADAARAGAANGSRRARSDQRGDAVRQRVRAGHAGGGAQARRLLRQRRRALPDGGHGDRRDSSEHPVGMAAQERDASPTATPRPAPKAGDPFTPALFARLLAEEYDKLRKASNRDVHDNSKDTTLPIAREIVETYVSDDSQAAVVHRPAEHQPGRARSRRSQAPHPAAARRVSRRRHARDREPRLRSCGAGGVGAGIGECTAGIGADSALHSDGSAIERVIPNDVNVVPRFFLLLFLVGLDY